MFDKDNDRIINLVFECVFGIDAVGKGTLKIQRISQFGHTIINK